jgi:hypothetical protein
MSNDIDILKQELYIAMEIGDKGIIYDLSVELDKLIVEFYMIQKNLN